MESPIHLVSRLPMILFASLELLSVTIFIFENMSSPAFHDILALLEIVSGEFEIIGIWWSCRSSVRI